MVDPVEWQIQIKTGLVYASPLSQPVSTYVHPTIVREYIGIHLYEQFRKVGLYIFDYAHSITDTVSYSIVYGSDHACTCAYKW